jgi:uncharacterized protein
MKFALWALFILLLIWLLRGKKAVPGKQAGANRGHAANGGAPQTHAIESIVRCTYCGLHVPASESVTSSSGLVFCSEEHRQRHAS